MTFYGCIMRFVQVLTNEEITTLKACVAHHNTSRCRMRAHSVLLSGRGYKMKEIADIYDSDYGTVSLWLQAWESNGIAFIHDAPKNGRPNKLTEDEQQKILEIMKKEPRSIKHAVAVVRDEFNKDISTDTVKRLLKSLGQTWKRIRTSIKMFRNEKEFAQSKLELEELQTQYKTGVIDLQYFDESGFCLTPIVPYAWQPIGETIEIPASHSKRINVLGFLDIQCNLTPFVIEGIVDSEIVMSCFDAFCETIEKPTWIVIDNARIHTSAKFKAKRLEWEEKCLYLFYLPAYSPELNLIEILWRFIKYQWMPFSAYLSFGNLLNSLLEILKNVGTKHSITFA